MARTNSTKPTTNTTHSNKMTTGQTMTADQRQSMIQLAAYLRAEKRGFQGGDPVQDWVDAEHEIDTTQRGTSHGVGVSTN